MRSVPELRFSPGKIKSLIVEIVELLDLDYIVILLDEWIALTRCQAEFAEKLKRCFFGHKRIAVKVAADQYQSSFNNGAGGDRFRGFEINADAQVACDLDRPFRDPKKGPDLYADVLYRRLVHFEPELAGHFGESPLANRRMFTNHLFSNEPAFKELCRASNGLVRDFLRLFKISAKRLDGPLRRNNRITLDMVRHATLENLEYTLKSAMESVDSRLLLFDVIVPHLRATEAQFFLIPSRMGGAQNPVLRDLLAKRLIHAVPGSELHPSVRNEYDRFGIEYGMFVDLMRSLSFSTGRGIDDGPLIGISEINGENALRFVLDLTPLGETLGAEIVSCPSCGGEFSSSEPLYAGTTDLCSLL